jgi:polyhydroxyalkanoate synthesis regulator phasin
MADPGNRGAAETLREAIERTLSAAGRSARTGSAALSRERATQLLDEVARRGREARDEVARRGLGARDELADRIETLEQRLSALEDALRTKPKPKAED